MDIREYVRHILFLPEQTLDLVEVLFIFESQR